MNALSCCTKTPDISLRKLSNVYHFLFNLQMCIYQCQGSLGSKVVIVIDLGT